MRLILIALLLAIPTSSLAAPVFSFNTVTEEEFIKAMRNEGLTIKPEIAAALVEYRTKNGAFKKVEDLQKVPGMTQVILQQLYPQEEGGDVVFDPESAPVMKGY